MRKVLERELIELGIGYMLGHPDYYYPYHSFVECIKWRARMRALIESRKSTLASTSNLA